MSENLSSGDMASKKNREITPAARVARLAAIGVLATSTVAAEGCAPKADLMNKASEISRVIDSPDMELVEKMTSGPTTRIEVVLSGVETDKTDGVRSPSRLREKAGWSLSDQSSFDTAVGILNENAYNDNGDLLPGIYEVPLAQSDSAK